MTVSIRASLIFSALGMAALTAAFANPPASKPAETAIAPCEDCELHLPPTLSVLAPATPETKPHVASVKDETCAMPTQSCAVDEVVTPKPRVDSAGPS